MPLDLIFLLPFLLQSYLYQLANLVIFCYLPKQNLAFKSICKQIFSNCFFFICYYVLFINNIKMPIQMYPKLFILAYFSEYLRLKHLPHCLTQKYLQSPYNILLLLCHWPPSGENLVHSLWLCTVFFLYLMYSQMEPSIYF